MITARGPLRRTLGPLAALALLAAACDDEPPETQTTATDGTAAEDANDTNGPDGGDETTETGEAVDPEDPPSEANGNDGPTETVEQGEPLAVLDSDEAGEVQAHVTELRRSGQVVELSVVLRNESDSTFDVDRGQWDGGVSDDDPAFRTAYGLSLVDGENNARHRALRDADDECVCSGDFGGNLFAGDSVGIFASFPAPPEDVDSMTVQIPQFGSVEVELQ